MCMHAHRVSVSRRWRGAGFRADIICISRGHDPEAPRTLAFPSLPSLLPYPRGSSTWYLFRVGFPPTLYLDTIYAFDGGSASHRDVTCIYAPTRYTIYPRFRCGTNYVRDNLTLETECVTIAILMRVSNIISVRYHWKRISSREGYMFSTMNVFTLHQFSLVYFYINTW